MFTPFPREALGHSIPRRFREQVARHAHRPAVRFDGVELDYRRLFDRVLRAAAMVRAGVGAEPGAVALLMPQGIDLVAATLGVLEAGGWYVPLDPLDSPEHLRPLVERSDARLVLTTAANAQRARAVADGRCPVACADRPGDFEPADAGAAPGDPDALACVYFTSGTTGAPKGVMDTHRNVLHNVRRYTNALHLTAHDRLTLLQAPHFSGAVSNVFGALLNGALLLPYDVARDGAGAPLARWMERKRPTVYHSVPSLFRSLCLPGHHYRSVRVVRLEGDAGAPADTERFARHFPPGSALVHGLGATETGICRQWFVTHGTHVTGDVLPIGYPVEDMEVRVVGENGAPAPDDQPGEIVVRSRFLSPGYWRDPERTAAAFRADPDDPGMREYRTGDLGRLRPDGCLEHLGRCDLQVKVRGQWVDVAAVESALATLPGVSECAVAARREEDGETTLAAFVVSTGTGPTLRDLRHHLAARVPTQGIPARGYRIAALPLGPNAKLDRRALAEAPGTPLPEGGGDGAPRDRWERDLATIWREVLGVHAIGIHDAFVERGGDSLKAVQVALAIEHRFGIAVPHSVLAESPTIEALAARIGRGAAARATNALVPIRAAGARAPLFCVHDLESDAFLFSPLAQRLGPDQPLYGLRYPHGEPLGRVPRTLEALATRYLAEIDAVAPRGPRHLAGFCYGGVVALEMARLLRARGEDVATLALFNVTAYDLGALVSDASRARFRGGWGERLRYLRRKPDALAWVARRLARTASEALWRAWLPLAPMRSAPDTPASPAMVRAILRAAFDRHVPRRHAGPVLLFLAEETLPLYADDPREAWAGLADGPIAIHRLPHDGYSMLAEPDVARVAGALAAWLGGASET